MKYAALAVIAAGCLYTDGINQKPVVRDIAPTQTLTRWDDAVTLYVDAYDPDGDPFSLDYKANMALTRDGDREVQFTPTGPGDYVITVTAVDDQGASSSLQRTITVPNMSPQLGPLKVTADAMLGADLRYPIETTFTVAIDTYADDDPRTSATEDWHLATPAGSAATLDGMHRFMADVAGQYTVAVVVTDPHQGMGSQQVTIDVAPDRRPCITGTQPLATTELLVFDVGSRNTLAVTAVDDDTNPFPGGPHGSTVFRWAVKFPTDDAFVPLDGFAQSSYVLDGSGFTPGDHAFVRVEVSDATDLWPMGCTDDARLCPYQSGCQGRETWEVEFR